MLVPRRLGSSAASGKCLREPICLAKGAGTLIRGDSSKRGATGRVKAKRTEGQVNEELPEQGQEMRAHQGRETTTG